MKMMKSMAVVAGAAALSMFAAPAMASPGDDAPSPTPSSSAPEAKVVDSAFSPAEIQVMAQSSGRSVEQQTEHVQSQTQQNNTYVRLASSGHKFDGAFFNDQNQLVVQAAPGSSDATAAKDAGLSVRHAAYGEAKLDQIANTLSAVPSDRSGVASIAPDIVKDRVVVTVFTDDADPVLLKKAAEYGDAVEVVKGQANESRASVRGGDKLLTSEGKSYCSAGFPATTRDGQAAMVWVGHCLEGQESIYDARGSFVGQFGATGFHSYDGRTDRDYGYMLMADGTTMSSELNSWGSRGERATNASRGAWKAPVGTEMCKSGATTGITCGQVKGYNASVTYSDKHGRPVAQVTGLGTSDVCSEPGDSGGAFTSNGYAVGMTSGGPSNGPSCGFNAGYTEGFSYFQPVTDALNAYGLTYAG
ncbi:S1 family peptidase [Devriesea agamarum]|uniref:S1 family peptidase n=1 Tax=Devriesea agamarum TaxID=472569 RepID=UPI00071C83FE|nr:S1 family peptidase [Devriesea agamarum]